jgi:hypothetical protein
LAYVLPADNLDPAQNVDGLAGVEEEDLKFPFTVSTEDAEAIAQGGVTNNS